VLRVLLVPVLVILLVSQTDLASYVAAAVLVVGAASDGLDGYLARRHATTTRTGQWLDPLADKILVAAPVLTLSALGRFPVWAAVLIVTREAAIAILRAVLGFGGRSMPAVQAAKLKTVAQVAAITLYILPLDAGADGVKLGFLIFAVVLTVTTGARYATEAVGWRRAPRPDATRTPT
jgi:CDP-diacylglycerol--glycerol-3-phosphate 3-phosphatidyltransferase